MLRSVLWIFIIAVGCAAAAAVPSWAPAYTPGITDSLPLMEAQPFHEVPTKLHKVVRGNRGTMTQFMLIPNQFQVCACTVNGEFVSCACIQPPVGLCAETRL